MWFYAISKCSIAKRCNQIDGRLLFHKFFHVPINAHILLMVMEEPRATKNYAWLVAKLEYRMTIPFFSPANVTGR